MRPLPGLAILAAIIVSTSAASAQATPGVIQGIVLTSDGKPIPRASFYYGRTSRAKGKADAVLPPVLSAKAGLDGRFTLSNLPPGPWTVCAVAAGYLDPCHWSNSPAIVVGPGQSSLKAELRLDQAYTLHIRINDPQGLLANEGKTAGAVLQIGVHAPSGSFHRANIAAKDSKGRDYTVAVPLHAAAKLFVSGGAFQLNDGAGAPLANNGRLTDVMAPGLNKASPTGPTQLGFTVTGLGKP